MLTADERTNSILLAGDRPARLRLRAIIAHLDTPLETGGNTQVVFLKYAKAEDLVTILQGTAQQQIAGQAQQAPAAAAEVDIQADETNNALVITAPPAVRRNLISVIQQLDIPRAQVLVEAVIAEISTDLSRDLGAAWAVDGTAARDDQGPIGLSSFGGISDTILGAISGNLTSLGSGMLLGVGDLREGRTNWAMVVRALAGDAATNILSTPTLVTTDNEEAEIIVGQNVPFVTGSYTTTGDTGSINNPFQTIQRQDVGLKLKVKPQVNEGDRVKLEIEQETSSIASSAASASDLITNKRSIKTSVMVEDGQVIVLGGLMEDSFRDRQEKVPLLGDIPLLGRLFRYDSTQKVKQNLMVFIHPVIISDSRTAGYYTGRKYEYLRARQLDARLEKRGLIRDEAARLPALEELITPRPPAEPAHSPEPPSESEADAAAYPNLPAPTAGPARQGYTVQVASGTNLDELRELARRHSSEALPLDVLGVSRQGRRWYVLVAGRFPDVASALEAKAALPPALRGRGPWVRPLADLEQDLSATPAPNTSQ